MQNRIQLLDQQNGGPIDVQMRKINSSTVDTKLTFSKKKKKYFIVINLGEKHLIRNKE